MKRYIKDGKIKYGNEIVIRRNGMQTINPSEEQILADGWVEYVTPEPTEEELLSRAKRNKVREIEAYDTSEEVNSFYMQGERMWLDKSTRAGLMLRFQAEQSMGKTETTLWYGSVMYTLLIDSAMAMLMALEVYASQCYDNTQRHMAAVEALESKEAIESYDYRVDYPVKLEF